MGMKTIGAMNGLNHTVHENAYVAAMYPSGSASP